MVKVKFYYKGTQIELECNPNSKVKLIFEQWAKKSGNEYKIIAEGVIKGKKVYYYNYEFHSLDNKLLNPELTLIQQITINRPTIVVNDKKINEIDFEKLKNEIIEEIRSPNVKLTYDKLQEHIVQYGFLTLKEIEKDIKNHPENYLDIKEIKDILEQKNFENGYYILGKLGESLEKMGLKIVIDKRKSKNKENIINNQFICSGLLNNSKYEVHLKENDPLYINNLLFDKLEANNFISKWKTFFSLELKIPEDKIFITNIREGSIIFDVIFKTYDFTDIDNSESGKVRFNERMENFINSHSEILSIHQRNIMGACKLSLDMLDSRGNQYPGNWAKEGSERGSYPYHPPDDNWMGFGLKVLEEYENDDWIDCRKNPNEWAVAYHGTSSKAIKPICSKNGKFWSTKEEGAIHQKCKNCSNKNSESKAKYDKCGEGAYCSPFLDYAEKYSGGVIIMCRVNPKEFRIPEGKFEENEWITDGTKNSIRPYRLLYKINNNN